jgi:hypothetical protein
MLSSRALLFSSAVRAVVVAAIGAASLLRADPPEQEPRHLPGELSADQVLDGTYPFPPSPVVESGENWDGFARDRLSKVPAPGVHPRMLMSPEDLPGLRDRLKNTAVGRELYANLRRRLDAALHDPKQWGGDLYARLAAGDQSGAEALIQQHKGLPGDLGHYQPWLYCIVLEAFDATLSDDKARGQKAATALATYAAIIRPRVDAALDAPLGDDVWRAKVQGSATGVNDQQGVRDMMGYQLVGYAYDFSYNFMTDEQRDTVRSLIARATYGRLWMGARLPHHFRNWNWIMIGLGQPLLALSIEGEKGYDPRVYKMGVQIARDYLTYGLTPKGVATEAVGYMNFGLIWGDPFLVAAQRRGDNLLVNDHLRAMVDWYLQCLEPSLDHWTSHGDGGDGPPGIWTLSMFHYYFPSDPKVEFLWQSYLHSAKGKALSGDFHLLEPILWACDSGAPATDNPYDFLGQSKLNLPLSLFDPTRSSLMARSGWAADAAMMEFECRTDSVGSSHEHADRGVFTFSALGRPWAKYNFRSIETRHHNGILIDGLGEGQWPGPGRWLGLEDKGWALVAACDDKPAYDWWWPKEILTEDPQKFVRFQFPRWSSYVPQAEEFHKNYDPSTVEKDDRPSVVAFWKGFDKTDPRQWDEDTWPKRLPHNPVERAFRTVAFVRGSQPYLLVVDDIQKDAKERLYEWLMQTGMDTAVARIDGNDIVLCDATVPVNEDGFAEPPKGSRELLVRVLGMNDPAKPHDYQSRPSFRLETFERKDTLSPESAKGALAGSRSFGLDRRLVIASRSAAPAFKILLFPLHAGDALPATTWNADHTQLVIATGGQSDTIKLTAGPDGRTRMTLARPGETDVAVP